MSHNITAHATGSISACLRMLGKQDLFTLFSVTFCVKPPEEDAYVSSQLAGGRGWEPDLVSKVMEAMTLHPEAVFLDLGSNIGAYTLPVASMRRRVVAVDMMRDNLAYIKTSLSQAGLESYVEMVNNAVR